jgi:hypothetical protein
MVARLKARDVLRPPAQASRLDAVKDGQTPLAPGTVIPLPQVPPFQDSHACLVLLPLKQARSWIF